MMTRILLSTNVRDERNLLEWVLYHLKIGFDGIWIWDDFSTSEWSPETLLKDLPSLPHGKNLEIVHGKDHPRVRDKKAYMNKAKQYAYCNGYDWVMHTDLDEYFYCEQEDVHLFLDTIKSNVITSILSPSIPPKENWGCIGTIAIPWVMYGSSYLHHSPGHSPGPSLNPSSNEENSNTSMKEENNIHSLIIPYIRSDKHPNEHMKALFRVSHALHPLSPHHWEMQPRSLCIDITGKVIPNRAKHEHFKQWSVETVSCFLGHYVNQSWEDFCRRRSRGRDDTRVRRAFPFALLPHNPPPKKFQDMYNSTENRRILSFWIR
jgi:hypothetical protein